MHEPSRIRAMTLGLAGTLGALATSGCASFDGQAEPAFSYDVPATVATTYAPTAALAHFYGLASAPDQQRAYRDQVIGAYLAAADVRYMEFRRNLSRQMKATNLGFDLAVLGLSGGASLAGKSAANALSAGAAGLTGSRAAVSKELWFDKTLPALFSAMDAERTRIRTDILGRKQADAAAYSLAEAFSDLARYQEAASLDTAIKTVTAAASEKAVEADAKYATAVLTYTAPPPAAVTALKPTLKKALAAALATPGKINLAADAVNVPHGASDDATLEAIIDASDRITDADAMSGFIDKVKTALNGG